MNSAINYSTHAQIAVGSLTRGSSTALGSVLFFAHVIEFAGFLLPIYDVFIKKCHLCDKCKKPMNKATYFLGSNEELQIDTLHKGDFSVLSNLLVSDDITQLNGFVFIYKLTVYRCVDCQEMIAGLYEVEIYRSDNKIEENNSRAIIKEMPVDNKNRLIIERLISKV